MKRRYHFVIILLFTSLLFSSQLTINTTALPNMAPYQFFGNVTDEDGNRLEGITVQLEHIRNGEKLYNETNSKGAYVIDVANLNNPYINGDKVIISILMNGVTYEAEGTIDNINYPDGINVQLDMAVLGAPEEGLIFGFEPTVCLIFIIFLIVLVLLVIYWYQKYYS